MDAQDSKSRNLKDADDCYLVRTGMFTRLRRVAPLLNAKRSAATIVVVLIGLFVFSHQTTAKRPRTKRGATKLQQLSPRREVASKRAVVNFGELALREALNPTPPKELREIPEPQEENFEKKAIPKNARLFSEAAGIQAVQPLGPSPPLSASFQASPGDGGTPPDTQGAAGPNHLMIAVNGGLRVQTKDGSPRGVVHTLGDFFAPVSNGLSTAFDPELQYDPYGQRWILVASANSFRPDPVLVVGVSKTSDPTGDWNLYSVDADPAGNYWIDHPLLGFNKNWIVVSASMIPNDNTSVKSHADVFAFNKLDLYSNGAGKLTRFSLPNDASFFMRPTTTLDSGLDTMYLLQQWLGNSNGVDSLRLYTITGAVGSEVLNNVSTPVFITTTSVSNNIPIDGAPQLGSPEKLATNGDDIQNVVFRNGSLWCVQTVFLPADGNPTRSLVQWWQISPNGTVLQRGRIEDPTGNIFYAFPSIAVNARNDVLIGYARFSATQYGGSGYAFRGGSDPPNSMRDDTVLKSGENTYSQSTIGHSRWGDYSATVIDPSNDIDMWTTQEYAGSSVNTWNTWWGRVTPPQSSPTPTPSPTATPTATPTPTPAPTPGSGSLVVTNTNDSGPGSLRQAISEAPEGTTIAFSLPAGSSILLTTGELSITKSLTIAGPGANLLSVQRSPFVTSQFRVFHVRSGNLNVAIFGLTISNGRATSGAGVEIESTGFVSLSACTVTGNSADFAGGGIDSSASGPLSVASSTISNNTANYGGGIYVQNGTLNLANTTISGNSAQNGGGLNSQLSATTIVNTTIVSNSSPFGGGLYLASGSVSSSNTIVAGNTGSNGPDIQSHDSNSKLTSQGYNLIGNNSGATISSQATDQIGTPAAPIEPVVGPLADNGGPTKTHALLTGSRAIDKGSPRAGITTDQRGLQRPVENPSVANAPGGDSSDIGAFEVQVATASPLQLILDQAGPASDQVAILDSVLLLRDPFPVVNTANLFNKGLDRNTRVMIFAANLQLAQGETAASVVVNIIDKNSQSYDIAAEDVRAVPNFTFVQVIFRLPDNLPVGMCAIRIKAHNQISNAGTMRIRT